MEKLKAKVNISTPSAVIMRGEGINLSLRLSDTSQFSRGDEFEITVKKTKSAEKVTPAKKSNTSKKSQKVK